MPAGGPINIGVVKSNHRRFAVAHEAMVNRVAVKIGESVKLHVQTQSTFKRRTAAPGSLKDATSYKFVRIGRGKIVRIKSKKEYASYINDGTRNIRPFKFFDKAIVAATAKAGVQFIQEMRKLARRF